MRGFQFLTTLVLISLLGCARFPQNMPATGGIRLIFKMKVNGKINPAFVYIFAIRTNQELQPSDHQGPIPVIQPPWGNGFVAGKCTHFVQWEPNSIPEFNLYKFTGQDLINYSRIGQPTAFNKVEPDSNELRFELNLFQLTGGDLAEAAKLQSLQVNFLTMDRIPLPTSHRKIWDAIGNSNSSIARERWIHVPLNANERFDNAFFGQIEPQGDCPVPDLDIIDFSIEVLRVSS